MRKNSIAIDRDDQTFKRIYWIGRRVQIPAWCDQWMRGDRYGEACAVTRRGLVKVRMDKSNRVLTFSQDNLDEVGS